VLYERKRDASLLSIHYLTKLLGYEDDITNLFRMQCLKPNATLSLVLGQKLLLPREHRT